jgi:hypothetical protein
MVLFFTYYGTRISKSFCLIKKSAKQNKKGCRLLCAAYRTSSHVHPHLVHHGVLARVDLLPGEGLIGGAEEGEPTLVVEHPVYLGQLQVLYAGGQVQLGRQLQQVWGGCVLRNNTM